MSLRVRLCKLLASCLFFRSQAHRISKLNLFSVSPNCGFLTCWHSDWTRRLRRSWRRGRSERDQLQHAIGRQAVICKKKIGIANLQAVVCQKILEGLSVGLSYHVPDVSGIR